MSTCDIARFLFSLWIQEAVTVATQLCLRKQNFKTPSRPSISGRVKHRENQSGQGLVRDQHVANHVVRPANQFQTTTSDTCTTLHVPAAASPCE